MTGFRAASALICRTVQVSYTAEKYQKPLNIYEHMHECNDSNAILQLVTSKYSNFPVLYL